MPEPPIQSSAQYTKDWLRKKFGTLDDNTLARLLSIKMVYNLSNDEVYVNWESFVVTQGHGEMDLSLETVGKFEAYLQQSVVSSNQKKTPALKKVREIAGAKRKPMMDFSSSPGGALPPSTPRLKKRKPILTSEPDSSPTKGMPLSSPRKQELVSESNTVVETLNPHIEVEKFAESVKISANFQASKFKFRSMAMNLLESADVLDEQIDIMSSDISERFKGSELVLGNPCMSSQNDIICCGRIVPDSPTEDPLMQSALNDTSLYLETSRLGGIGQRIPLNVSQLSEYSFFPGQIVGLKGSNPTGSRFVVSEVLEFPELEVPVSTKQDLVQFGANRDSGSKVFVAAGPFSNHHNLNFDKLSSLVDLLNTEIKPQVAVFFGPFIDLTNKAVESGDMDFEGVPSKQQPTSLDELFKHKLTPIFKKIDPQISVVLVPSVKDANCKHTSYPQASFERRKLGLPKNFRCYPNPSSFYVNEAQFKVSNMDVFKDLKDVFKQSLGTENSKISPNRFDRIATHIFQQNKFYPMFPGSVRRNPFSDEEMNNITRVKDGVVGDDLADIAIGGACLEVPFMGLTELGELPDVLLIPSEMKYFAKVIKGVVLINPGQFIRPARDAFREEGSYTVLSIKPADETIPDNIEPTEAGDKFYHNVYRRCRVDIYKS